MFDNRVFNEAMEASRSAAERGDWTSALDAAETAIAARPDNVDARNELAIALYHNAHYARAITVLQGLHAHYPSDLLILAYLARAYEGDNQPANAAATLLTLGEQAVAQHLLDDALEAFEEAVRLTPTVERARIGLAEVLVALGERLRAAEQCMMVAQQRYGAGDAAGAREALDEALSLDPGNLQARRLQADLKGAAAGHSGVLNGGGVRQTGIPDAARIAQLATQAQAHQRAGDITTALRLYQAAVDAGAERPDVWYNLALLQIDQGNHAAAIPLLHKAITSPEYAVKAATGLGHALRIGGDGQAAIDIYTATIATIDEHALSRADATDVVELYNAAADAYAELGEFRQSAALCDTLATMLQHKRWGHDLAEQQRARAKQFTQRLLTGRVQTLDPSATAPATGEPLPAAESSADRFAVLPPLEAAPPPAPAPVTPLDTTGCSDEIVRLVEASAHFMEEGLVWAALDACQEVIRIDTNYLPIHLRLCEMYERQGQIDDALAKYRVLIDTYLARDCATDAIAMYERMIELAPDDLEAREQLVALLRGAGQTNAAMAEAITIATTAFRMGQTGRAIELFEDIHTWATPSAALHIEHGRALLKLERWHAAAAQWQQAAERDPHHPVALSLHVLALAIVDAPAATLWNTFAALLDTLSNDHVQLAAVQGEYRLALLLADSAVLHFLLGLLQQTAQQHDLALMSFEQALSSTALDDQRALAPVLVHQAMVRSYLALNQQQLALEQLDIIERLLHEQPTPPPSPHAFARPLTPDEVKRMVAALRSPAHHTADDAEPSAPLIDVEPSLPSIKVAPEPVPAEAPAAASAAPVPQIALAAPAANGSDARTIAVFEANAQRFAQAGRYEQALTELYRGAMAAWMVGQPNDAIRLVDQGVAWAPQLIQAWQQQVHLCLLLGDEEGAAAAQREIVQIALMEQPEALDGSAHQLLVLVPDDAEAQSLVGEQAVY